MSASSIVSTFKKIKLYLKLIAVLMVILFIANCVIAFVHFATYIKKNINNEMGPEKSCPYRYSSFGLETGNAKALEFVSNLTLSVIYSPKQDSREGILNKYRDGILNSYKFQTVKIFLLLFIIVTLGASFIMGFSQITGADLLKRFGIIALVFWATDSSSYKLYDDFLYPLVLNGLKELMAMTSGAFLAGLDVVGNSEITAFINRNPDSEFVLMDAFMEVAFSQVLFNKIGALLFTNGGLFMFSAPIYLIILLVCFFLFFFVIGITMYKVIIIVGLSLFPFFALFGMMAATSKSLDKFSVFFSNYLQSTIIKPVFSIVLLTFAMSFLVLLMLRLLLGAFSFEVCIKNYFYSPVLNIIGIGKYDYFEAIPPLKISNVYGEIVGLPGTDPEFGEVMQNAGSTKKQLEKMLFSNFLILIILAFVFSKIMNLLQNIVNSMGLGSGLKLEQDFMKLKDKTLSKGLELAKKGDEYAVEKFIDPMLDAGQRGIVGAAEAIKEQGAKIAEKVQEVGKEMIDYSKEHIKKGLKDGKSEIERKGKEFGQTLGNIGSNIKSLAEDSKVGQKAKSLVKGIEDGAAEAEKFIKGYAGKQIQSVADSVSESGKTIQEKGKSVVNAVSNFGRSVIKKIKNIRKIEHHEKQELTNSEEITEITETPIASSSTVSLNEQSNQMHKTQPKTLISKPESEEIEEIEEIEETEEEIITEEKNNHRKTKIENQVLRSTPASDSRQTSKSIPISETQNSKPIPISETQTSKPIPISETQTSKPVSISETQTSKPVSISETQTSKPVQDPNVSILEQKQEPLIQNTKITTNNNITLKREKTSNIKSLNNPLGKSTIESMDTKLDTIVSNKTLNDPIQNKLDTPLNETTKEKPKVTVEENFVKLEEKIKNVETKAKKYETLTADVQQYLKDKDDNKK